MVYLRRIRDEALNFYDEKVAPRQFWVGVGVGILVSAVVVWL